MKHGGQEIVRVSGLRHRYPDSTELQIGGQMLTIRQGERIVLLGPNGSGKTTLLHHIIGLLEPTAGQVEVFGVNPKRAFKTIRQRIGVVFQNPEEQIIAPTVQEDIAFAPINYGIPKSEVASLVQEIMQELDIWHLRAKIPHYLSGGEKKKVALAGAMVMKPELLILDEPFNGLDPRTRLELVKLLNTLNDKYGTALLITTHDMDVINLIADQVYILNQERQLLSGTPEELLTCTAQLRAAGLEPPELVALFYRLAQAGLPVKPVLCLETAVERLMELYQDSGNRYSKIVSPKTDSA